MPKLSQYIVRVEEVRLKHYKVKAGTERSALSYVEDLYNRGNIKMNKTDIYDHYISTIDKDNEGKDIRWNNCTVLRVPKTKK